MVRLLLLALFSGFFLTVAAQQPPPPVLDENSIVKDSTGFQYPYIIWRNLFQSGKYGIKSMRIANAAKHEFLLYAFSGKELAERMERMPKPRETTIFKTGTKLRNFKATDITGKKYELKELAGKTVVLNFWFINCPPCRKEIPELNILVSQYQDNPDVVFLAIALDEKYEIKEFLKKSPFLYNIIDRGRFLSDQYHVKLYPTHVVLDGQGVVKFHSDGLANNTIYWIGKTIKESLNTVTSGNL